MPKDSTYAEVEVQISCTVIYDSKGAKSSEQIEKQVKSDIVKEVKKFSKSHEDPVLYISHYDGPSNYEDHK